MDGPEELSGAHIETANVTFDVGLGAWTTASGVRCSSWPRRRQLGSEMTESLDI